jgi:hypothetical protein
VLQQVTCRAPRSASHLRFQAESEAVGHVAVAVGGSGRGVFRVPRRVLRENPTVGRPKREASSKPSGDLQRAEQTA